MGATSLYGYGRYKNLRDFMNKYLIQDFNSEWGENYAQVDHSIVGNVLYQAIRRVKTDEVFIAVITCSKNGDEFIYKHMQDSMYPYYFDCPERLLKLATEQKEDALRWYANCREVHANRKRMKQIIPVLQSSKKPIDVILETHNKKRVSFSYVISNTYFAGVNMEDNCLYRWKFNCVSIDQWEKALEKVTI